jgi:uncharacterized protein (DUF433 family)
MEVLGHGVYDIREAARLTGLKPARLREWFRGWSSDSISRLVFRSDYAGVAEGHSISFLELVEVFVTGHLREHGVSLRSIRRAHAKLQNDWETRHPFARGEIRTDGENAFVSALDDRERRIVSEAITKSLVFERIILPTLEKIDYDPASKLATKWHLSPLVVLDPRVCFGQPIVEPVGITTYVLTAFYLANGRNAQKVANWYEIEEEHVLAAVEFETMNGRDVRRLARA